MPDKTIDAISSHKHAYTKVKGGNIISPPTPEQKEMLEKINAFKTKQIEWLKYLNSIDSDPNDGRVDISVFNKEVASKYGWKPSSTTHLIKNNYGEIKVEMNSVDIEEQAESMVKQHFGEDKIKEARTVHVLI